MQNSTYGSVIHSRLQAALHGRVISQTIRATDKEGGHILKEFRKWYNIWNAVNTISNSWAEMKECTMHGC